jgi:hypothetical protein
MKPSASHLLVLVVGLAAGWGGASSRSPEPAPAVTPAGARGERVTRVVASIDEAQLAELRAEMARLAASRPAQGELVAPAAVAAPAPVPPTAEGVAASERAEQQVDEAIARGAWTDRERRALRGVMTELTNEQTEVVMSKLVLAINDGRLKPDASGPLF